MAWTPHRIANEFLSLAEKDGRPLTNMQLQKLVYIAHGFTLAILDEPLVYQNVHAFDFGPVFPKLYKALARFGAGNVTERLKVPPEEDDISLGESAENIIRSVWATYGKMDGAKLSRLTHQPGTPWSEIYPVSKYGVIPNGVIEQYYRELLDVRAEASHP
jgi:uncharacterized phage-associated protein